MPLFGLGDIVFNKGQNTFRGPLQSLVENKFTTTTLRYPLDVGSPDKGHYMVFYIKKQANSKADEDVTPTSFIEATNSALRNPINNLVGSASESLKRNFGGELSSGIKNTLNNINNATGGTIGNITSSIGNAFKSITGSVSNLSNPFGQPSVISAGGSSSQEINRNNIKSLVGSGNILRSIRNTTRTNQVISMYMPDTLQFDYTQSYEQLSLGANPIGIAGVSMADLLKQGQYFSAIKEAIKSGGQAILQQQANQRFGAIGQAGGFLATGAIVNPLLEVIYTSPQFRSFQYDFLFYPRDEREAVEVQKIINAFQYHQAPEFKDGTAGTLLIPPSEFDIQFYYAGKPNANLPKIGNCVLRSIQVNYAPNGFSAYEVPGQDATQGGTGMPVAIQMTLQFQETEYLTKNLPTNAFGSGPDYGNRDLGENF